MKKITSIAVYVCCAFSSAFAADGAFSETPQSVLRLEDVVKTVSARNYEVLAEAMRVYQAKESIQVARGELLPKLNLWKIIGIAAGAMTDPASLAGSIQDIAPFLVPANWFRVSENKILYKAETEGYRALWANEVHSAKALYIQSLMDEAFLGVLDRTANNLKEVETIAQLQENAGYLPPGSAQSVSLKRLSFAADRTQMEKLLKAEKNQLSYSLALPAESSVELAPIPLPNLANLPPLDVAEFEFRALDASPERRQFAELVEVVPWIKREIFFAFLGASNSSRGVVGGVFDSLPMQDGLGFGTGAAVRIISTQKEILETQLEGISETLRRSLRSVVNEYNADLLNYQNFAERKTLISKQLERLRLALRMGEQVSYTTFLENIEMQAAIDTSLVGLMYRFTVNQDRLSRLLFGGDYIKKPASLEQIRKGTAL